MKTFIWTETKRIISRTYGGADITAAIYRVKKNRPVFVGESKWCTRGYRGEFHEVVARLVELKELPKNAIGGPRGYANREDDRFEVLQVG